MAQDKLTKAQVDKLKPGSNDYIVWDKGLPNFGVRVKPSGVKSYLVQYRNRQTGQSRRKTIGQHGPLISFNDAKERAKILLSEVLKGNDPVQEGLRYRNEQRVEDLAKLYIKEHAIPKKRPKSILEDRAMISRFILPSFGNKKISQVGTQDLQRLHNRLKDTPYQANRVLSLLSKMFTLAMQWKLTSENPASGIQKFHEEKRFRWLDNDELARLLSALDNHTNQVSANAIRLQLLTGARIGEILSAKWKDIDLSTGMWTKPSHNTKQKRTEHLPLSNAAIELFKLVRQSKENASTYIFTIGSTDRPIKELKRFWKQVIEAAGIENYRMHDNRHTHASHLVSGGVSLAIVGRLLGHTNPTTTLRYAHLADQPLRDAANLIGNKIDQETSRKS